MRKFLLFIVIVLVIGAGALYFFSPTLIKMAIESGGSQAAGTQVAVNEVDIGFQDSRASLRGLTIANPAGFSDADVLSLGEISVAIDPTRTSTDVIAVSEFRVSNPVVVYEMSGGTNNIAAIQKAFEQNVGTSTASADDEGSELKFIVDRLVITQGEVQVKTDLGELASTDLPEIDLSNVGTAEGGLTGGEIGSIVVSEISGNVAQLVAAGAVKGLVGGAIGTATGAVGEATDILEDAGGGLTEGLKKIPGFGRD
jgi:hypothetical protein